MLFKSRKLFHIIFIFFTYNFFFFTKRLSWDIIAKHLNNSNNDVYNLLKIYFPKFSKNENTEDEEYDDSGTIVEKKNDIRARVT